MVRSLGCVIFGVVLTALGCASEQGQAGDGDTSPASSPSHGGGSTTSGSDGSTKPGGGGHASTAPTPTLNLGDNPQAPQEVAPDPMCQPKPVGILRDFQAGGDTATCPVNMDFQNPLWGTQAMPFMPGIGLPDPGIVQTLLGRDKKPMFSGVAKTVHSATTFAMWYRDEPTCNRSVQYELPMRFASATNKLVFDSKAFFPLDDVAPPAAFGPSGQDDQHVMHDFHFTFELRMTFRYAGNESFEFIGDDDLWVFINGKLAIDLGGVHAPMTGTVDLPNRRAELGLEQGKEYPIDFFQAERMTTQSNFHIETSLAFTNCKPIIVPK